MTTSASLRGLATLAALLTLLSAIAVAGEPLRDAPPSLARGASTAAPTRDPVSRGRGAEAAPPRRPPAAPHHGAVAAEHPRAAEIGIEILRRGGNAVDAAIAVAYAVCVLNASSCGIGGGGFMLIAEPNGRVDALDYRETAPALAHRDLYRRDGTVLSELASRGALAVAVPGEVAGLEAARARFATLSRRELMEPAIRLARDGFPLSEHVAAAIAGNAAGLRADPSLAARLLHADGTPLAAGETVRFPELAATLEHVADVGADGFYRGRVAGADRGGAARAQRHPDRGRPRPLPAALARAAAHDVPRSRDRHDAAAELGRRAPRDPRDPRARRSRRARRDVAALPAPPRRSDGARLRRSRALVRRSGLHARAGRPSHVAVVRGGAARAHP